MENTCQLTKGQRRIDEVLDHLRREDRVESMIRKRQALEVGADELRANPCRLACPPGGIENRFGDIDAYNSLRNRPQRGQRSKEPAIAAASVEERTDGKVTTKLLGKHGELAVDSRIGDDR